MESVNSVKAWFRDHVCDKNGQPYQLDDEQAAVVCDAHKNTLVAARAGAGKTHTLVAKIIYLIGKQGVDLGEIRAFVFNRSAAAEINERLAQIKVDGKCLVPEGVQIASTFHSFAYKLVKTIDGAGSFGDILADGQRSDAARTGQARSLYIQAVVEQLKHDDQNLRDKIYGFFREEASTIDKRKFAGPKDYYEYIRNHDYLTLRGETVKSFGEKVIADFFFEHGIDYKYEPEFYPFNFAREGYCKPEFEQLLSKRDLIKADFRLPEYNLIWEHWAITGRESEDEIAKIDEAKVIGDYQEYKENKTWKKWFYSKVWQGDRPIPVSMWYQQHFDGVVETYYSPLRKSREEFEQELREVCERKGIEVKEIERERLIARAWRKQVKYFTTMLTQFIDRVQQDYADNIELLEQKIKHEPEDETNEQRVKAFHEIGLAVYKEYLRRLGLRRENRLVYVNDENQPRYFGDFGTDFSMLLQRSSKILKTMPDKAKGKLGNIKYILVDEYQDFSKLFYNNLWGIYTIFPDAKLLAVGDDWQAINRFAGSDDCYFTNFETYFHEDTNRLLISHNYRSAPEIVENANHVMKRLLEINNGFAVAANQVAGNGLIKTIDLSTMETHLPDGDSRQDSDVQKYIEAVSKIILEHRKDKRILILHRRNEMLFRMNIWGFVKKYVRDYICKDLRAMRTEEFDRLIHLVDESDILSVHRSKGQEADTVILLETDPKIFPSNPFNAELFEIFGDNFETYRKDEARLYYVAITRAKKNLYVLWGTHQHSEGVEPDYISALQKTDAVYGNRDSLSQLRD